MPGNLGPANSNLNQNKGEIKLTCKTWSIDDHDLLALELFVFHGQEIGVDSVGDTAAKIFFHTVDCKLVVNKLEPLFFIILSAPCPVGHSIAHGGFSRSGLSNDEVASSILEVAQGKWILHGPVDVLISWVGNIWDWPNLVAIFGSTFQLVFDLGPWLHEYFIHLALETSLEGATYWPAVLDVAP